MLCNLSYEVSLYKEMAELHLDGSIIAVHNQFSSSTTQHTNQQQANTTIMSKGQILITGVNGFIAARSAKYFLDQGYSVRGTVRRLESAKALLEEALVDYAKDGKFEVVEVPDITSPGAFDEAVKGKIISKSDIVVAVLEHFVNSRITASMKQSSY